MCTSETNHCKNADWCWGVICCCNQWQLRRKCTHIATYGYTQNNMTVLATYHHIRYLHINKTTERRERKVSNYVWNKYNTICIYHWSTHLRTTPTREIRRQLWVETRIAYLRDAATTTFNALCELEPACANYEKLFGIYHNSTLTTSKPSYGLNESW